jgi:2-(1,2-epoxy-1,2-dihydrophenyl)acetyl-CoA isomerase
VSAADSPQLTVDRGVATIRLNRPERGNALNLSTARGLRAAVGDLSAETYLAAVVLAADGRLFCAGGDVREMAAAADRRAYLHELAGTVHEALVALRELPVPVIAAVQGTAAGAGLGLILAADIAIASDQARFVAAYGDVGLSPDCGVTALLPAAIGSRRASLFTLTDLTLDAPTAVGWGLITACCPPDDLDVEVSDVVARLTARPAAARGATALLLRHGLEHGYPEQLDAEADSIAELAATPPAGALIDAFTRSERSASE